ncbi:hypothetical protein BU15DRAFT_70393 [Melanogaster broomeanus]|nr:hypothetical protein BU15DRAFT_70393 [Melanogaster broomeanus]
MSAVKSRWSIACPHADDLDKFKSKGQTIKPFFQALQVSPVKFKQFQVTLQSLAQQYLDLKEQFQNQQQWRVDNLMRQVPQIIPWMADFEDAWPVAVYLTRYLRNVARPPRNWPGIRNNQVRASRSAARRKRTIDRASLTSSSPDSGPLKKLLESARPSLADFLPNFVTIGIDTTDTLYAFLEWTNAEREAFLVKEEDNIHLTRFQRASFLMACKRFTKRP